MQTRLRFWPVVFLAVAVLGSAHHVAWAQLTGRSAVDARRRVRATLAAAMADGTLSEVEEEAIYRWASRLLTPQELPGLRRTLRRLASRQEGVPESTFRMPAVEAATQTQHATQPVESGSTDSERGDLAKTASYQEPAPIEAGPPFDGDPTPAPEDA